MELEDSLRAGTLLRGGKYRIVKTLGQGGFGITYKAKMKLEAEGAIGKMIVESDVAIKEFFLKSECERAEGSNAVTVPSKKKAGFIEDYRKKFVKEANNLSRLNHENIVKVIDIFEENSTAYFVMEYIEGESLDSIVEKQGAMSETKAKEVIGQLAKAVDYIHRNKVLHFDIKPANILISETGSLKLVDFGLAKHYYSDGKQTSTGLVQGVSEGFSPVEQYKMGSLSEFSPRTDIYSVGATMAYLLTGKVPPSALDNKLPALPSAVSDRVKQGIYAAMANFIEDRPKTISEFMQMIGGNLQPQIGKLTSGFESKGWSSKDNVPQPCVYGPPIPRDGNDSNGTKVINGGDDDKKPSKLVYWFILVIIGLVIFIFYVKDRNGPSTGQEEIVVDTCAVDTMVFEDVTEEAAVMVEVTEETNHLSGLSDKTITVNGVSFKMVAVKGGTFTMGATSEQGSDAYETETPTHRVTLSDYYIGETEVTQALWEAVMGSNPSSNRGSNLPVEMVSWDDCRDFIKKLNSLTGLNFRLPTEAEWEYAARGGNKSKGYKYSGSNNIDHVAWYEDTIGYNHAVKQKQANELGLYDMSGNVEEWCLDWKGSYSSGSQTNPTGPSSGEYRVLRGGSGYDCDWGCRVSFRGYNSPGSRNSYNGLRVCLPSL